MTLWFLLLFHALPIEVKAEPCLAGDVDEIRRLLALELKAAVVETHQGPGPHVRLRCRRSAVSIEVTEGTSTRKVDFDLRDAAPAVRARLLALGIAEQLTSSAPRPRSEQGVTVGSLVASPSWAPPRETLLPLVAPQLAPEEVLVPLAAREVVSASTRDPPVVLVGAGGGFGSALTMVRLRVIGLLPVHPHVLLRADVGWGGGAWTLPMGLVRADVVDAEVSAQATWSRSGFRLRGGVGARLGAGWLVGQPLDAGTTQGLTVVGPLVGPAFSFGVDYQWARWFVSLEGTAGLWVRGLRGTIDGASAVGVTGAFGLAGAAVGFAL